VSTVCIPLYYPEAGKSRASHNQLLISRFM
jgi:hypothetical protein